MKVYVVSKKDDDGDWYVRDVYLCRDIALKNMKPYPGEDRLEEFEVEYSTPENPDPTFDIRHVCIVHGEPDYHSRMYEWRFCPPEDVVIADSITVYSTAGWERAEELYDQTKEKISS